MTRLETALASVRRRCTELARRELAAAREVSGTDAAAAEVHLSIAGALAGPNAGDDPALARQIERTKIDPVEARQRGNGWIP